MTERQRRDRVHDQRPPSRYMRSLLRQARFRAHSLLRDCERAEILGARGEERVRRLQERCRRATAREPRPDWLVPLTRMMPASIAEAAAMLNWLLAGLRDLDTAWRQRLIAAGIDPKWPGDDA